MPGLDLIPGSGGIDIATVQSLIAEALPAPVLPDPPIPVKDYGVESYHNGVITYDATAKVGDLILVAAESSYGLTFAAPGYTVIAQGATGPAGDGWNQGYVVASKILTPTDVSVDFQPNDYAAGTALAYHGFAPSATLLSNISGDTAPAQQGLSHPAVLYICFGDAVIETAPGTSAVATQRVYSASRVAMFTEAIGDSLSSPERKFNNATRVLTMGITQDPTDKPSRVPKGGAAGSHLVKLSDADYDTGWVMP